MGMQLIETIEVGSGGAASIEFTGIPQDGVDLVLVTSLRTDRTGSQGDAVFLSFNASTANFTGITLFGNGATVTSNTQTRLSYYASTADSTASTFSNGATLISNYTSSANKSVSTDGVSETNGSTAYQTITATQWADTSAITSITLTSGTSNDFDQYSTASLYKITAD